MYMQLTQINIFAASRFKVVSGTKAVEFSDDLWRDS